MSSGSELEMIKDIWETFRMFDGGFGPGEHAHVTPDMEKTNLEVPCHITIIIHCIQFLRDRANVTMERRTIENVIPDESQIHSGDFFGVIRLDGLDPMIAWGMGASTGYQR